MVSAVQSELLESYLQTVEEQLRSLPPDDRSEVVRELRSHVLDSTKGELSDAGIRTALAALGDPLEIARINLHMREVADAVELPKPLTVASALTRVVTLGGRALLTFVFSLMGYGFAGCWLLTAFAKPFVPARVGLWVLPDPTGDLSLSLGRRGAGAVGHDILGWWIIPIGVAVGAVCIVLTYRMGLRFIRQSARSSNIGRSSCG